MYRLKMKWSSIVTVVMLAVMLVACGEDQQQVATTTSTEPTQAAETPKPTEEPIQVPTATPTPIPTEVPSEAPTPTVSPYVMGDIDFTEYYNGEKTRLEIIKEAECDSIRVVVLTFEGVTVLKDGDSFEMNEEEESLNGYLFYIYSPKVAVSIDKSDSMWKCLDQWIPKNASDKMPYVFTVKNEYALDHCNIPISLTYEDGSEETITINLTKPYGK